MYGMFFFLVCFWVVPSCAVFVQKNFKTFCKKPRCHILGFFQPCGQKSFNFIEAFSCYKKMRGGVRGSV